MLHVSLEKWHGWGVTVAQSRSIITIISLLRVLFGGVNLAATRGVNLLVCGGQSLLECRFVNSRETPEGGFLKGNYTSGDYAAVHNGNWPRFAARSHANCGTMQRRGGAQARAPAQGSAWPPHVFTHSHSVLLQICSLFVTQMFLWRVLFEKNSKHILAVLKAYSCSSEVALFVVTDLHTSPWRSRLPISPLHSWMHTSHSSVPLKVIEPGVFWSTSLASFNSLTAYTHKQAEGNSQKK